MGSATQNQNANGASLLDFDLNMPGNIDHIDNCGSEPMDGDLPNPTVATVAGESTVAVAADVISSVPEPLASGLGMSPITRPRSATTRRSSERTSFQMFVGSEPLDWELLYRPTAAGESSAAAAAADAVDGIFSVEPPSTSPGPSVPSTIDPHSARSRRHNARNLSRLEGRVFVHSHTAQPMSLAAVYADADSEDEVDNEIAAIEDIRNLNQLGNAVNATEHQIRMMHLWNTFKKDQRVLADGHMPWACEAFSTLHKQDFDQSPELLMCWNGFLNRLNVIGLLDTNTIDKCLSILNSQTPKS
ncbi:uncharacterized protein LOC143548009 [Bidens hawaiensis]|uniref:uncharacterized protein LOC143548009 n=1 Tax=Bidens hawaiensis TaxID=980011 RepID=UPI004049D100